MNEKIEFVQSAVTKERRKKRDDIVFVLSMAYQNLNRELLGTCCIFVLPSENSQDKNAIEAHPQPTASVSFERKALNPQ